MRDEFWMICEPDKVYSCIDLFPTQADAEAQVAKFEERYGPGLIVLPYSEFDKRRAAKLLDGVLHEVTEEQYHEALNVLPPMKWHHRNGVERFLMCEFYTGSYTTQYARRNGRYFSRMVDAHKEATWITAEEIDRQPKPAEVV